MSFLSTGVKTESLSNCSFVQNWQNIYTLNPNKPVKLATAITFPVFGLGLACQADGKCCHTKKSNLAKIFTEKTSKSAKYRLPVRFNKKKTC